MYQKLVKDDQKMSFLELPTRIQSKNSLFDSIMEPSQFVNLKLPTSFEHVIDQSIVVSNSLLVYFPSSVYVEKNCGRRISVNMKIFSDKIR